MLTHILACLLLAILPLIATAEVAVIELRHRTPEQVIPSLRPHLSRDGALSGFGGKLIVSTDTANLAALRGILAAIDQPERQLMISVRQEDEDAAQDRGGELSGRVGDGATLRGRVWSSRDAREGRTLHQVRVSEGGTALIRLGVSVPVTLRQVVLGPGGAVISDSQTWRDLGSGFTASPSLAGDRVTLDISPSQETWLGGGAARLQRLSTTVSGRLGEWIVLGGGDAAQQGEAAGYVSHSSRDLRRRARLLLKVDEVRD